MSIEKKLPGHYCDQVVSNANRDRFKNASAFLLRDARHAMHDILLLRISAILPEAISDGGVTPTTDTDLLLATYRGGSHFTSDMSQKTPSLLVTNDSQINFCVCIDQIV